MSRSARLKLGKTDVLYITLHPRYLHLKLVQPGKAQYEQNIYIPRRKLTPLIRWLLGSLRRSELAGSWYPPDAEARYLEREREHHLELKRQKREAKAEAERRSRQKKRYRAAQRRARRRT